MKAEGWAIVDGDGISIRSVCQTERGAIVNWLVTQRGRWISTSTTDEQIKAYWDEDRGNASAVEVIVVAVVH